MHYVCIENNAVVGILDYEPNVPESVSVMQITDEQNSQLQSGTHYFDISTATIIEFSNSIQTQRNQEIVNGQEREFLNSTDWKILRHIRQKALGVMTSLSDAEYLELEQQRQAAAARII